MTREMRFRNWRFQCVECGTEFEGDVVLEDPEGDPEGVINSARTSSGELAVLSWEADPVWEQIGRQVVDAVGAAGLSPFGRGDAGRFVKSRLLDPSPSGETYEIGRPPPCPRGHGFEPVINVGPDQPIEIRTMTVPLLGHAKWDAMAATERRAFIERGIADYRLVEAERRRRFLELAARSEKWPLKRPVSG